MFPLWTKVVFPICALASVVLSFKNPIIPGFNPDPTFLRVGDDFFISTSTFEFFPGHPIYHSKDLTTWTLVGHGLSKPSQLQLYGLAPEGGIWAPALRFYDGTYYLFTTNRRVYSTETHQQSRIYFVTTKDIFSNQWSDPTTLDVLGYDADIFMENGTVWVTRADVNNPIDKIYDQTTVDLSTGRSLSSDALIFNGTLPLNSTSRPEGPHIYKRGSFYYLLIAEGGSSVYHRSTIQRGPTPSGPWTSYSNNPLIYNGVDPDPSTQPVQWTGHSDIVQTANGDWWGVCLGIRPQGGNISRSQLGRETFLFPVNWTSDGWPVFNNNQSIGLVGPGLHNSPINATSWYDDFSSGQLDLSYYFLRTPYAPFYSFHKDTLRIEGSPIALGDRDTPSLLLRKQTAFNQVLETKVDFVPTSTREEAGITIWYSDFYHDDIFVSQCPSSNNASRCVVFRSIVANNGTGVTLANATSQSLQYYPIPDGSVTLSIKGQDVRYSFGYSLYDNNITWVGAIDSIWLFTAPTGYFLFKGAQFGLYATGGEKTLVGDTASFHYWSQETYAADPV